MVVVAGNHPKILEAIKSKPLTFFATAVRHLFLDGDTGWSRKDAIQVLSVSTGLKNFAAIGDFSSPHTLDVLSNMHVERMALCLESIFGGRQHIDLTHPAFAHVTHIDIFDEIDEEDTIVFPQIPLLPALTHLCLNNGIPWSVTQKLLQECRRLELFIILWPSSSRDLAYAWAQDNPVRDARIRKNLPGYFIANLSKISRSSNILQSFSKLLPNVDKVSKMEILLFISMTLGT
ncbi:hypothetical protein FB45DRAFT_1009110 [Roridomyces roridus]|uniref:Uncharacterized protein n=1 Tax=Roridomyces roridus TaxID=1738132 RepID=A0AAD7B869_9AGAR|nr:hypothetical protein FB45DRAFT_1009110 [Roridomyces roridus]